MEWIVLLVIQEFKTQSVYSVHSVVKNSSSGESLVHVRDDWLHAIAEELVHFAEAALGVEGGEVEVVALEAERGGEVR